MPLVPLSLTTRIENGAFAAFLLIAALVMIAGVDLSDSSGLRSWEGRLGTIPGSLYPRLRRMWVRWQRGAGIGALIGLAVGESTFLLTPGDDKQKMSLMVLAPLASFFVGAAVGRCVAAITTPSPRDLPQRVARTKAADLKDYLSPLDRVMTVVALALAITTLVCFFALWASGNFVAGVMLAYLGPVMAVLALLCWLGGRALARRLLETPEPAASMHELVWLDAARASVLRKLGEPVLGFGLYGLMCLCMSLDPAATAMYHRVGHTGPVWVPLLIGLGMVLPLAMLVPICVLALVSKQQQYDSWFLKRLWPDGSPTA